MLIELRQYANLMPIPVEIIDLSPTITEHAYADIVDRGSFNFPYARGEIFKSAFLHPRAQLAIRIGEDPVVGKLLINQGHSLFATR